MLCDVITMHLNKHNLLKSSKHGFVINRSCLTNLPEYFETLTDLIDQGHFVDVFQLDFFKTFNWVPHQRRPSKPRAHRISGSILRWIESWMKVRKQKVVLNGSASSWSPIQSGVPVFYYLSYSSMTQILQLTHSIAIF